ncbi:MAG: AAA family ATPase [Opitutaceae bacterium]|nr:AAA family ATPase [Opitutaceae bacterium]
MKQPVLYIFSGLPGAGKSTLAQRLATRLGCVFVRIDTIEQSLRELCSLSVQGEGYQLACRIAADNLSIGISVVADSCNPIELTRTEWEDVARSSAATPLNIEITCTDKTEHRQRVETRQPGVLGLRLPTWQEVEERQYDEWTKDRIVIDTSGKTVDEAFDQLGKVLLLPQQTKAEPVCSPSQNA